MPERAIPEATRLATARASNPRGSAWVSANAGAGKTYVLTLRVLRLLLDGQDPSTLLCLTFTKAAAAEMAARVFGRLADWTRLDDDALAATLAELKPGRLTEADLAFARGRFARALETPGGLKIQTIHAFCESLLHQFPLEAGVPASFAVLDDREAALLMDEARAFVLARAAAHPETEVARALSGLTTRMADGSLADLIDKLLQNRHALMKDGAANLDSLLAAHARLLGLPDPDPEAAKAALADPAGTSPHLTKDVVAAYWEVAQGEGTKTDRDRIAPLWAAHQADTPSERAAHWQAGLFTGAGKPRATGQRSLFKVKDAFPEALDTIAAEQNRLLALTTHLHHADLMTVALAVIAHFERLKTRRGALDFDDLIARTAALLTRSDARAWVGYKIDQRIDHVLVDEAQDTSGDQWRIIRALSDDFFDGKAARETVTPTFFAVGDDKQSIYSFQGADPRQFDTTRRELETKAAHSQVAFEGRVPLRLSFRSTRDVLSAVDTVFARDEALAGVTLEDALVHEPHRAERGLVELWPIIKGTKSDEPEDWLAPYDAVRAPHLRLADAIADRIASMVQAGRAPGDVLILLRTRGAMADAINRALKKRAIAVAGTDRLVLTDHIAVEDLMALIQTVLLPEDDLSLAELLVSPLVGLSDAQLERLAADRPGLLIDALNAATDDPAIRQAQLDIKGWRALADFASPYTFLATVLGRDGGRRKFIARLGEDCRDPLDEVLRLARAEESRPGSGLASLEAFLATLRRLKLDIKRDMETRADKVRIMTVHGAKGLEAHTVFLVDTCRLPRAPSGLVETGTDGSPLLHLSGSAQPAAYRSVKEERQARQLEEYRRLLYVAMTRARDQLIVTGHMTQEKDPPEACWYDLIDKALGGDARDVGDLAGLPDSDPMRVWRADPWPAGDDAAAPATQPAASPLDLEPLRVLIAESYERPAPIAPLRPSKARDDAEATGLDWQDKAAAERHRRTVESLAADPDTQISALRFGSLVHALLEDADAPDAARAARLATRFEMDPTAPEVEAALTHALAVHGLPQAPTLFGPQSRGEVPLRGSIADRTGTQRPVTGSIDRLVVTEEEVWAIDFKTNATPPAADRLAEDAAAYVAQLALYQALLQRLFPERPVRCGLIWTQGPRWDWLADAYLDAARQSLGLSVAISKA